MSLPTNIDVLIALQRVEQKVDSMLLKLHEVGDKQDALGQHLMTLVEAMAEEDEAEVSLDGSVLGRARDEGKPL